MSDSDKAVEQFRTRVINICKGKADEWEQAAGAKEHGPDGYNYSLCKRDAANQLREAIENLDHQGD